MQLLAVAHGGTLGQRAGELHPGMGALPAADSLARRHPVALEGDVARLFGTSRLAVNTLHHQIVSDPGDLVVNGRAEDGAIEALVARDWPALGVQWHPEKMVEPEQAKLFAFVVTQHAAA